MKGQVSELGRGQLGVLDAAVGPGLSPKLPLLWLGPRE